MSCNERLIDLNLVLGNVQVSHLLASQLLRFQVAPEMAESGLEGRHERHLHQENTTNKNTRTQRQIYKNIKHNIFSHRDGGKTLKYYSK